MSFTSKAVVHRNSSSPVELVDYEIIPPLSPTQIVVKTEYSSINPIDVKLHSLTFRSKLFHTLKDFSGTVVAAGSDVSSKWPVGEKVYGSVPSPSEDNYVGSYTLVDTEACSIGKLPSKLSFEQGAALGVAYGTAYQMLERANESKPLTADSHILILGGATSVGTFATEIAKLVYGVKNVAVTCSPSSAEYVKEYGADSVINYRVADPSAELQKFAKQRGIRFDSILDCVGGYDALRVFPDILKPASEGSTYISVMGDAAPSKTYAATMINALLIMPRVLFRMFFGKYYGINYSLIMLTRGEWTNEALRIFNIPNMRVPIDSVYPREDIKAAWDKVDSTRARGKVVVKMQ